MKKFTLFLSCVLGVLLLCYCNTSKPTKTSSDTSSTENSTDIVIESSTEVTEDITETTEYIDPQCIRDGIVYRPNPDQYIDAEIYQLRFEYYEHPKGQWDFYLFPSDQGINLQADNNDIKYITVYIDQEHAQKIYDELSKYKFYYWKDEDFKIVDENGVITCANPPYTLEIYSPQFWNTTSIRLNDEDLESFLAYCYEYFEAIYDSQT